MGNIYVTCARCNKGMAIAEYNCVFCSDIDNQFVCADCFKKEQPKELMKRIADLEAKLAESESKARTYAKEIVFLDKQLKEKEKEETKRMEGFEKRCQEYYNSDEYKKDFAIAELEKVKKEFNGAFSISIQQEIFDKYIDQQIKSLKGDK